MKIRIIFTSGKNIDLTPAELKELFEAFSIFQPEDIFPKVIKVEKNPFFADDLPGTGAKPV